MPEVSPDGTVNALRGASGGSSRDAVLAFDPVVCVTGETTHALTHEGADASEDGTGRGTPIVAYGDSGMGRWSETDVAITLAAQDAKGGNTLALSGVGRPRRLTPRECELLMAWDVDHTAVGMDEQGRTYRLSDTARYRLCGNGIGSTQAEWIGRNLLAMEASC